jgi:hypothetical protein
VVVTKPAGRAYDQVYAAFTARVPVAVADVAATASCDTAARGAELRLAFPFASPVRPILQIAPLDQQLRLYPPPPPALRQHPWYPRATSHGLPSRYRRAPMRPTAAPLGSYTTSSG